MKTKTIEQIIKALENDETVTKKQANDIIYACRHQYIPNRRFIAETLFLVCEKTLTPVSVILVQMGSDKAITTFNLIIYFLKFIIENSL